MNKKQTICMWIGIVLFVFFTIATPNFFRDKESYQGWLRYGRLYIYKEYSTNN